MSRGASTIQAVVLIAGLVVLVLGIVAMVSATLSGPYVAEEFERSFSLPPGTRIEIEGRHGPIDYAAWDRPEVLIRATKEASWALPWISKWFADAVVVSISEDGRGVRAFERFPLVMIFGNMKVRYEVRVPRSWSGEVVLTTSNGSITAQELGGDAEIRTSNGPITVTGQSGTLRARTSNGPIELANIGGAVDVESNNGPVRVDGGVLRGTGSLRTSNGEIHVRAKLDPGANYDAQTSNGRVSVVLVEPDVVLSLRTSNGTIDLETDVNVSQVGRNSLDGRIGNGASRLSVRTSNGDIVLSQVASSVTTH